MNKETFSDGSTIETDETTGNRTVCGKLAHDEYFRRLEAERIIANAKCAVIAYCRNLDGTRKAELIRKVVENPITRAEFGPYAYEVWNCDEPATVVRYLDEVKARKAFKAAMLHGTNGTGKHIEKYESKPDWYTLNEGEIVRAAGSQAHCESYDK